MAGREQCLTSMVLAMADARFPPPDACDCHVHVIGPKQRFPLARERTYTPMDAPVGELAAMLKRLALARVVLVQPSFYRSDNSCMLDALAVLDDARGVAVLPPRVGDDELDALDDQGIRGLRVNIATVGRGSFDVMRRDIEAAAALCERHGWHVQIFVPSAAIEPLAPTLLALPVATVIDHFGLIGSSAETNALGALLRLLETGKIWLKISGAYRIATDPADAAIGSLARKLCAGITLSASCGAATGRIRRAMTPGQRMPARRNCHSRTSTRRACSIWCHAGSGTTPW